MTTIILTVIITIVVYQLIIFIVSLADLYNNEKMQLVLCGVWSLIIFVVVRPIIKFYQKCKLHWFNAHYTNCIGLMHTIQIVRSMLKEREKQICRLISM